MATKYIHFYFLNGDDHAQGTHMSMYIVLLKEEYDAIVWWSFTIFEGDVL
ncbi:unnamed protein product, partial [Rotaria sp. Silwood1]